MEEKLTLKKFLTYYPPTSYKTEYDEDGDMYWTYNLKIIIADIFIIMIQLLCIYFMKKIH